MLVGTIIQPWIPKSIRDAFKEKKTPTRASLPRLTFSEDTPPLESRAKRYLQYESPDGSIIKDSPT